MIRLLDHPYLFTSEGRNIQDIEYRPGITVAMVTKDIRYRHEAIGFYEFYITVNGFEVHDLNKELIDEDFVAISIKHEFQAVMAVVWMALYNAELYAAINVAAYVITTAIFIGAGLLLNSIMSPSAPDQPDTSVDKPSYGWAGMRNETEPGNPVPVAYGTPYSSPHIIGSYRVVENHDVWQYILCCASAGKTNNILTANDIFIGQPPGELLTSFTDYRFGATDGDIEITAATRAALVDFAKVHHDRPFDRRIFHTDQSSVKTVNLLRFNSLLSAGAIEDEVGGVPDWTKVGDVSITDGIDYPVWTPATLKVVGDKIVPTTPNGYYYEVTFLVGTNRTGATEPVWATTPGSRTWTGDVETICRANADLGWRDTFLNLQADAYISSDDFESLRLDTPGQIEFWVRFPNTNDRAFLCKHFTHSLTYGTVQSLMTFGYKGGNLYLQAISGVGADIASVATWTEDLSLSAAFTPATDTWYYLRVQAGYSKTYSAILYQIQYGSAGTHLIPLDSDYTGFINNPDPDATTSEPTAYTDQTAAQKARYASYIGTGYFYDTSTGTLSILYANCDFDEFRYSRGLANSLTDSVVPTAEFTDPEEVPEPLEISTLSEVDSVRLIFEFTQGLFRSTDSGLANMSVKIRTGYKLTGSSSSYTYSTETYTAKRSTACRYQKEITLPARGKYDIIIERLTAEDPNDDSKQRSASFLTSFEEIIDIAQYYPGLQIISLAIKATETRSGSIDLIRVKHNRTMIDIPNWEGGTVSRSTSIPAYQMIDMFTNPYYGIREDIGNLDKDRFYEWAFWTEEMVGNYHRARSHLVFDERWTFSDAINAVEQVGRARILRIGSTWSCVVDKPKSPQYVFSAGNIIKDSAEWSSYEDLEKADVVEVAFWNNARRGQRDSRKATASWFNSMDRLPKIAQVEIRGIIYADQAQRQAQMMVNKNEFITRLGKIKSFLRASLVELGDAVYVIPPTSQYLFGGMLPRDHDNTSIVYLDRSVNLPSSDYSGSLKIFIVDQKGRDYAFDVYGPWNEDTTSLNISSPLTADRFSVWGLGRVSEDRLLCQIVKKTVNPKDKNVTLEFCEYSDSVFYHEDYESGTVAL